MDASDLRAFRTAATPDAYQLLIELRQAEDGLRVSTLADRTDRDKQAVMDEIIRLSEEAVVAHWTVENGTHVELTGRGLGILRAFDQFVEEGKEAHSQFRS